MIIYLELKTSVKIEINFIQPAVEEKVRTETTMSGDAGGLLEIPK